MVCDRCISAVKAELDKFSIKTTSIKLGEAEIAENISEERKNQLNQALKKLGFELIDNKRSRIIEKIKTLVVELVYQQKEPLKIKLSTFISEELNQDYTYLSNLFSEVQGVTIEHFFISQKIERVKELLIYDELSLSQIAFQLNYSSTAHLSSQFKKMTGMTPTQFKQIKEKNRTPINRL